MTSIAEIFRAALNKELENKWGGQSELARETGFSLSKIHSLTTGARKSYEDDSRLIAEKLGYPGRRYEDFLDIGRRELGLPFDTKSKAEPSPEVFAYLEKARVVLEGPEAELFKRMIDKFG